MAQDRHLRLGTVTVFARCHLPAPASAQEPPALPPIVLLHESLGSVRQWKAFPQALADATGRTVWAYDRPGFGQSSTLQARPGLDFIEKEAREGLPHLVDQLGLKRYVVYGHSVGGPMALTHAAHCPGRVAAVISEAGQAGVTAQTLQGIREAVAYFADPINLARLEKWHGEKTAWVLDAWAGVWLDAGFAGWSLDAVLPQVTTPTLALHGQRDQYGPPAFAHTIASGVSGPVQLNLWPDCGHHPHREHTSRTLRTVADFLHNLS